jgi:hypothetical protein
MRNYWYSLKVYLYLTAFLVWFIQSGHRNPTVAASVATGKISVRTTGLETYCYFSLFVKRSVYMLTILIFRSE